MSKHKNFFTKIKSSVKEVEIEVAYAKLLKVDLKKIGSCDGIHNNLLFEFKYNVELKTQFPKPLAQLCTYMNKIKNGKYILEDNNNIQYGIVLDKDEVVIVPIKNVLSYIESNKYNWDTPPSSPCEKLVNDLGSLNSDDYTYFNLTTDADVDAFIESFNNLKDNGEINIKIDINENNFIDVFNKWHTLVGSKLTITDNEEKARVSAQLFLYDLVGTNSTLNLNTGYLVFNFNDPSVKIINNIRVNPLEYNNFWKIYNRPPSARNLTIITNNKDQLIDMMLRRKQGEFYTPINIVKKEILNAEKVWNTDFSDHFIWDMAAGTGNLLKCFKFNDYSKMFISTLNKEDITHINDVGLFNGATKFAYDFLNQDDDELPGNLYNALMNKDNKWLFILNPPYANAGTGLKGKNTKRDVNKTKIQELMKNDTELKLGKVSKDLQNQFIYKICKMKEQYKLDVKMILVNAFLSIYTKPTFDDIFRLLNNNFNLYESINMYNSKDHFNTLGSFDITVTLWSSK